MRIRITVKPTGGRREDLVVAADLRRVLWEHAPIETDREHPLHGTHRDETGRAYVEFVTPSTEDVVGVLDKYGYAGRVEVKENPAPPGPACQNCGNVTGPNLPPLCPNCGFRDISPCPVCHHEVPREHYTPVRGDLFRCPDCRNPVRFRFNEPMFISEGTFNQPLIVTEEV